MGYIRCYCYNSTIYRRANVDKSHLFCIAVPPLFQLSLDLSVAIVLVAIVKQVSLSAAERCRPQFRDACLASGEDAAHNQWMRSLAGIVATRPTEDVEKAVVVFEQYNEPFLASRLKCE